MDDINITAKELAGALDIPEERLIEICNFFDSDPKDDWELIEGFHFQWGPYKSRVFSPEGATELCKYLEENEERPFRKRFKRWFFRRDRRLKGLMVSKRVFAEAEKPGELIFNKDGRAFLSPRSCRNIMGLGTRQDILNRTFREVMSETEKELLKKGKDFDTKSDLLKGDYEGRDAEHYYYTGTALASLGQKLSTRFSQKHRRDWAAIVSEYLPKAILKVEKNEGERKNDIKKAMDAVKRNARGRCQITNQSQSVGQFDLEVHHIFDRRNYPKIAAEKYNLIAISSVIHKHFHQWNGGSKKSCTIEDLEKYIETFSASLFRIDNQKKGDKKSKDSHSENNEDGQSDDENDCHLDLEQAMEVQQRLQKIKAKLYALLNQ
jgi:hypothetical protein